MHKNFVVEVPIWSKFLFSHLILYFMEWTSAKKFLIWIKSDLLWMVKNLKILFSCGRPAPLNTASTCSELWSRFRNMWLQACLILLVLPLWCDWWTKMAANLNVFKTLKKDWILSKSNFSFAEVHWVIIESEKKKFWRYGRFKIFLVLSGCSVVKTTLDILNSHVKFSPGGVFFSDHIVVSQEAYRHLVSRQPGLC